MSKKRKIKIECPECERTAVVHFTGKAYLEYCPFCGQEMPDAVESDESPILNTFEDYDEHSDYEEDD